LTYHNSENIHPILTKFGTTSLWRAAYKPAKFQLPSFFYSEDTYGQSISDPKNRPKSITRGILRLRNYSSAISQAASTDRWERGSRKKSTDILTFDRVMDV